MARTVQSVTTRGDKKGEPETSGRVEDGENVLGDGSVEERVEVRGEEGRGKRKRKGATHFQFHSNHTLFSETTSKYKQKNVAAQKKRDSHKRAKFYKNKHFSELKQQVRSLKSVVKSQAVQIKAKMKKIMTLQSKK